MISVKFNQHLLLPNCLESIVHGFVGLDAIVRSLKPIIIPIESNIMGNI